MDRPIILVVSEKEATRRTLVSDLRRRLDADYRVLVTTSGPAALDLVGRATGAGEEVALLVVDEALTSLRPVELMVRVREIVPTAKRVLLVDRGDWSAGHPVVSAMALGQVDFHLYNPWAPLERILYPAMSEFLAAWDKTREPRSVPLEIVGVRSSPEAHELRDSLTRAGLPFWFHDPDSPAGIQLLAEVGADGSRLPVLRFHTGTVLVDPVLAQVWEALGMGTRVDVGSCDLAVVGAGPAGLASAVYAASEGLDTLVLEPSVPGGQAGTSSMIRNYLGFQRGVSGDDLANRAVEQAWLFGTRFVLSQAAIRLDARGSRHIVTTTDGSQVTARATVIATGVTWRRLGVPALESLVGAGVFYGAAGAEARAMQGLDVFVVGAGNSAGQAAMHLSRYAASVTLLVRGTSLRSSMSDYLVSELENAPTIRVRLRTEVVDGSGTGRLETLTLRDRATAETEVVPAAALFLLIGAEPRTDWLTGVLARDDHGFLRTGPDLLHGGAASPPWPLRRPPLLFETSIPGVFAVGDVRHRSVKRVAAAVGEGSTAIQLVHEYLAFR